MEEKFNFEEEIEEEIIEEEIVEKTLPFDVNSIKVSNKVISLESLIKRLKYDEIDLTPEFQRNPDLWNRTKMSRLIESIILRLPLPIFYFDVSNNSKWVVIDGLQRLSTLKKFIIDKKLTLGNLEFLVQLNGKKYDDLDRSMQRVIEETQINTYQIEPQTPKEVRYSIFNRINTGGLILNPQEIRQALNQKNRGIEYLKEIVEDSIFKEIVKIKTQRMLDRELVLRYFAFRLVSYEDFYKQGIGLSKFLDNTMEKIDSKDFNEQIFEGLKLELLESLKFLIKIFEIDTLFNKKIADKTKTATLNRSLFEVWTVLVSMQNDEEKRKILEKKELLKEKYKKLLQDQEFNDSITKGTNDKKAVYNRFKRLESLLEEIKNVEEDRSKEF